MATLLIEYDAKRRGAMIAGRVIIGRIPDAAIAVNDTSVSRLHAWIDRVDGQYILTDCGSLTGTLVNDQLLSAPCALKRGDKIRIGKLLMVFSDQERLPEGVTPMSPPGYDPDDALVTGTLFNCACGAPAWAAAKNAGQPYTCMHCGRTTAVSPAPVAEASKSICPICHVPIGPADQATPCPECWLTFHSECWRENLGCCAYGCSQVGVLKPYVDGRPSPQPSPRILGEGVKPTRRGYGEYVLLGLAAVSILVGAVTFGIPPAMVALAAMIFLLARGRRCQVRFVLVSLFTCLAGAAAGLATSWLWWYDISIWERLRR